MSSFSMERRKNLDVAKKSRTNFLLLADAPRRMDDDFSIEIEKIIADDGNRRGSGKRNRTNRLSRARAGLWPDLNT